jgi:hypothetical protein
LREVAETMVFSPFPPRTLDKLNPRLWILSNKGYKKAAGYPATFYNDKISALCFT